MNSVNRIVGNVIVHAAQTVAVAALICVAPGFDKADAQVGFTCTGTIREIVKDRRDGTIVRVQYPNKGCSNIETIIVGASPPPPEGALGKTVTAIGGLVTEETGFFPLRYVTDVTKSHANEYGDDPRIRLTACRANRNTGTSAYLRHCAL